MGKMCKHLELSDSSGEWCKLKGCTCTECLDLRSPRYEEICKDREERKWETG